MMQSCQNMAKNVGLMVKMQNIQPSFKGVGLLTHHIRYKCSIDLKTLSWKAQRQRKSKKKKKLSAIY